MAYVGYTGMALLALLHPSITVLTTAIGSRAGLRMWQTTKTMRRVSTTVGLLSLAAVFCVGLRCAAAIVRSRAASRAGTLAARARKMSEAELLAHPTMLADLKQLLDGWRGDFASARVAADALCRASRNVRVKDALHELGVTETLTAAIRHFAEKDGRRHAAQNYRGRILRFDGAQDAPPGQQQPLPFTPRPFSLVQDVFLALASSLSDGRGRVNQNGGEERAEHDWSARQDGLLEAVPALLKMATDGPAVICVAHPHGPAPPAGQPRRNVRIWMELDCLRVANGKENVIPLLFGHRLVLGRLNNSKLMRCESKGIDSFPS